MTALGRRATLAAMSAALVVLASACGEPEPELTIEERLADVYGRTLSETEVAEKLATASMLCQLGEPVLDGVWRQLNERQLDYQDVVFGHICPERAVFYASLTGRYVTQEALDSGVVPSTTRPPLTVTTEADVTTTTVGSPEQTPSASDDIGVDVDGTDSTATEDDGSVGTDDPTAETTEAPLATIAPAPTETTVVGEGG